ncbi:MAG: methanol--corrinoid methyltransferase, partial [bacterium]|nr:methanol--corrinoid methyltransferase [bacterium]
MQVPDADELVFGHAPKPVSCGFDLTIGGGCVYPEVNFTLPTISIDEQNWQKILKQYEDMGAAILQRMTAL